MSRLPLYMILVIIFLAGLLIFKSITRYPLELTPEEAISILDKERNDLLHVKGIPLTGYWWSPEENKLIIQLEKIDERSIIALKKLLGEKTKIRVIQGGKGVPL